jgi:hypothetical protein
MTVSILQALDDRRLFASLLRDKATWRSWRAFLAALFGLPLSEDEAALFRACTGRAALPSASFAEVWLACGRRAGKSFILSLIAVFLAAFRNYREYLAPGERATIMVIAADRKQTRVIVRYVKALFEIAALAKLVENQTAESVDLNNRVTIEVGTASFRSLRGYTLAAALCDEIAFWPAEDSAMPDVEILGALRPAMATIPNAMLLCASSPYAKKGALWQAFKRYWASDDPNVLVWRAATRTMNTTVPQRVIDEAVEQDPERAQSEYFAEFRSDVATFIEPQTIASAIEHGVTVRAPLGEVAYSAFADPSGGSSDSFTLAITHAEGERIVLDYIGERKAPFSPASAVEEFAAVLKMYRLSTVRGDRYAGEWPAEAFRGHGVTYQASDLNRSEIYLATLPLLNSGRVSLLDNQRMAAQFLGLERRTSRGGRDMVDHAPGAHDDVANSVAGALVLALENGKFDLAQWARVIAGPDEEASRDVPAALPWHLSQQARLHRDAAANPNGEGGALHDIYLETRHRYDQTGGFGKPSAENTCERCKQPIISGETRVTDGISAYHARCSPWASR